MKVPYVDLRQQYQFLKPELGPALERVMERAAFILGDEVRAFEKRFAEFTGTPHCLGCANGSDALEMAYQVLGLGPGDEVLVPAHTWLSTATAVTGRGAKPVFVDSHPDYHTLDPADAARKVNSRTKAIVPVHLFGQAAPMDEIMALAKKHDLKVIEDCAQAAGTTYRGRHIGNFGEIGCFSFYPGKNLGAYGDAGGLITRDEQLAAGLRRLGNHGALQKYDNDIPGRNSRLDTLQAAVLNVKMNHLAKWIEQRRERAAYYDRALSATAVKPPAVMPGNVHSYHVYAVRVPNRDRVRERLSAAGVETLVHYPKAVPFLGAYAAEKYRPDDFPVAFRDMNEMISLPLYPEIKPEQQDHVVEQLTRALRES